MYEAGVAPIEKKFRRLRCFENIHHGLYYTSVQKTEHIDIAGEKERQGPT